MPSSLYKTLSALKRSRQSRLFFAYVHACSIAMLFFFLLVLHGIISMVYGQYFIFSNHLGRLGGG